MKTFILLICLLSGFAAVAADVTEFDTNDLSGVTVAAPSGKVLIESHDGPKAIVAVTKTKFSEHCKLSIEKKDQKITVKVEKSPRFFSLGDCEANYEFKIPKKSDTEVKLGSGTLNVKALQGELLFSLGSGEVTADGSFSKVDGKTGSGPVQITGLTGSGHLKSGSGSVKISYSGKPANGAIEIQLGSGDSEVSFPKGSKVKTNFAAGAGKLHNELGDTADASFLLSVKTGAGSLTVKSH